MIQKYAAASPARKRLIHGLGVGVCLSVFMAFNAQAIQCGALPFTQGLFAGDEIKVKSGVTMNGLPVDDGTYNNDQGVGLDATVSSQSYNFPDLDPEDFPRITATTTLNLTHASPTLDMSTTQYWRALRVRDDVSGTLEGAGPLYTREMRVYQDATLNAGSANLFTQTLKFDKDSELVITTGRLYLFIEDKLEIKKGAQLNVDGNVADLIIYAYDGAEIKIDKEVDFKGVIYSPGEVDIDIKKDTSIDGLVVTQGEITIDKDVSLTLDSLDLDYLNTLSTCYDENNYLSIGNWRLDEASWNGIDTDVENSQQYILHGIALGTINPVDAKVCKGALAESNGDYIEIADDDLLDQSAFFSLMAWIKPSEFPASGENVVLSKGDNYQITLDNAGLLRFRWNDQDGGAQVLSASSTIPLDSWTHVTVTYSSTLAQQKLYINGVEDATISIAKAAETNTRPFRIAAGDNTTLNTFIGTLDEVRLFARTLSESAILELMNETRSCSGLAPFAWFKLDEATGSLTGTPGELVDEMSQANSAYALGTDVDLGPAKICNGLYLPDTTERFDHIGMNTGVDVDADLGGQGTIAFWYKSNKHWVDGARKGRVLFDATEFDTSYGYLGYFFSKYFTMRIRFWGQLEFYLKDDDLNYYSVSSRHYFSENEWVHLAVSWDVADKMTMYVNGNAVAERDFQPGASLSGLSNLQIGDNSSRLNLFSINGAADGIIDEVMLYQRVLSLAELNEIMSDVTACDSMLEYFTVEPQVTNGSTCAATEVEITAYDSDDLVMTDYADTIQINTSSTHGNWSVVSGAGQLSPALDSNDDGQVSYTFSPSDNGVVRLALENSHADSLDITVLDQQLGISSQSDTITFSDNAFVLEWIDGLGDQAIAGRDHQLRITAWEKDPSLNTCEVADEYDGNVDLKIWTLAEANDPGGQAPQINAANLPASQPVNNNVNVSFTAGVAEVDLSTSDVGHYGLSVLDDNREFANNADITGDAPVVLVKPFGLAITEIKNASNGANPENSGSGGNVFTEAGSVFEATVSGVLWDSADDQSGNDGVLDSGSYNDNTPLPSFAWPAQLRIDTATGYTPTFSGSALGSLGGGALLASDFDSDGLAVADDLTYSEVGSVTLYAESLNYLNEASADLSSDRIIVGRFIPHQFSVVSQTDGAWENNCTAGGTSFNYLGQSFSYSSHPSVIVEAQNAAGDRVSNYAQAWAKLDASSLSRTLVNNSGQTHSESLAALQYSDLGLANSTQSGLHEWVWPAADSFSFDRDERVPFDGDLDFSITEIDDGELSSSLSVTLNPATNLQRFGRLRQENVHGSELQGLDMPVRVEYLDASQVYQTHSDDNLCSTLLPGQLTLDIQLNNGDTTAASIVNQPGGVAGLFHYELSAPAAQNDGYVDITTDLSTLPWLRYDWNGDGSHNNNPSARATFGIFKGNPVQIYQREVFR